MDPSNPSFFSNNSDYPNYPNFQSFFNTENYPNIQFSQNSQSSPNLNQIPTSEQVQPSQNISRNLFQNTNEKVSKSTWSVKEDVILMSSWIFVSEDKKNGRFQRNGSFWGKIHKMYEEARKEDPEEVNERNIESLKGRFTRLNKNAQKWIAANIEAHRRVKSGMSQHDVEKEAHQLYEGKFTDLHVFNEVMSKVPKWELKLDQGSRSRAYDEDGNEESGGSTKRTRTTEDGEYFCPINVETPDSGGSAISRPTGRDQAKKKKGKAKALDSSSEIVAEIRALRLTRDSELEVDRIVENLLLNNLNLNEVDHTPRGRRRYFERQRELGHDRLMNDYFVDNPTYPPETFRRRFRMRKPVFLRIVEAVTANDEYFQQRHDAIGRQGLSSLQKCTGAMRVLAYGTSTDTVDEYLRMSATVTRQSLMSFVEGVISCFGDEYLRKPNEQDLARLLHAGEQRGFPGMIGSIDCMHWEWKNCPTAWAGQYGGRSGKPTIILEAVASYDLWIWHAFFGTPGSLNDINVLNRSPIFNDVLEGRAPKVNYVVNGSEYNMAYYLTDGIYPSWAAFVKSITSPMIRKHKLFAQHQEAVRKDVERAFGVLQARFAFLRRPCLVWDKNLMAKIMMACIIIHNMIVEDERDSYQTYYDPTEFIISDLTDDNQNLQYSTERIASLSAYMTNRDQLRNRDAHIALKNDLIEHISQKFGTDN